MNSSATQESECSTHQRLQLSQSHLHIYAFLFRAHGRTTNKLPEYVRRASWPRSAARTLLLFRHEQLLLLAQIMLLRAQPLHLLAQPFHLLAQPQLSRLQVWPLFPALLGTFQLLDEALQLFCNFLDLTLDFGDLSLDRLDLPVELVGHGLERARRQSRPRQSMGGGNRSEVTYK